MLGNRPVVTTSRYSQNFILVLKRITDTIVIAENTRSRVFFSIENGEVILAAIVWRQISYVKNGREWFLLRQEIRVNVTFLENFEFFELEDQLKFVFKIV